MELTVVNSKISNSNSNSAIKNFSHDELAYTKKMF